MIRTLKNITDFSVIDQDISNNLYELDSLVYDDDEIGSGGFGSVYKVKFLNGKKRVKYVLKIFEEQESQTHAFEAISILHQKIKRRQYQSGKPIFHEFPQLLGIPFMAFKAFDDIEEKEVFGFLMFDLSKLGYTDYGLDNQINILEDVSIEEKIYYAYQLAKVISFLHSIRFIHADISENAIWINRNTKKLALIDYDSGFNYDEQEKPSTIGKLTNWISGTWNTIIGDKNSRDKLTILDRLNEENWLIANACFEIILGLQPYFFLTDVDDETKKKYFKEFNWPNANDSHDFVNIKNLDTHSLCVRILEDLRNHGLNQLIDSFELVFNDGYFKPERRLTTDKWKNLLFNICSQIKTFKPVLASLSSDKLMVEKKGERVNLKWKSKNSNIVLINEDIQPLFKNSKSFVVNDHSKLIVRAENDFGYEEKVIEIRANKKVPKIKFLNASEIVRSSSQPVKLSWSTIDSVKVEISHSNKEFKSIDSYFVNPKTKTRYTLTAFGNFDDTSSAVIEIDVVKPEILSFDYEVNLEYGLDNVDLIWKTQNAEKVEILPKVGERDPNGIAHVSIIEPTEFILVAKGLFDTTETSKIAQPFPIPIVKSILVESPKFDLDYSFDSKLLNVPSELFNVSQIKVNNEINFKNNLNYSLIDFRKNTPEFNYEPKFIDYNQLEELNKNSKFNLSEIFKKISKKIKRKLKNYDRNKVF